MTYQEAYKILEINETTDAEEIKKSYKKQAKNITLTYIMAIKSLLKKK